MVGNSKVTTSQNRTIALKIAITQFAVSILIACILWAFFDFKAAYSALLGGMVSVIGTLLMGKIMFAQEQMTPKQMLLAFYLGEATKVIMTAALLILAFMLIDLNALAFIVTFIITLSVNWIALFYLR